MSGRKTVKRALGCAAALLMSVLVLDFSAFAEDTTRFVPGTSVNGVSISGLTAEEAKAKLEGYYGSDYKLTIKERGGKTEEIKGAEIGLKAAVPDSLPAILEEQNQKGRSSGPAVDNTHTMTIPTSFSEADLKERVRGLSCVSGGDVVETKNAHISAYQEGVPFTIVPQVQGNSVSLEKTVEAVKNAVSSGADEISLEEKGCYDTVTVTSQDESLKKLLETMNQYKDMSVSYVFGEEKETLAGETICTWLTGSENGRVTVDREQAAAYVKSLADKYDTVSVARPFKTADGRVVNLNGTYGWKINQAAETDALVEIIQSGQTQDREPVYAQAARARTGGDWGSTYAEVDLTGQHVYLYENGEQVWDAPCVTGDIAKGHTTPEGIFSLAYKETDRVLRGAKQADGTYEYESHVDYWMPFNGGIGFHDASWRNKFGGTIYQYAGSHGCINLPVEKAKILYDKLAAGVPVICYN